MKSILEDLREIEENLIRNPPIKKVGPYIKELKRSKGLIESTKRS
jgi:hypothetical protein